MPQNDTLTINREDLLGVVRGVVDSAVSGALEQASASGSSPGQLAASEIDRDAAIQSAKRVKFWAGILVSAVTVTAGGVAWIYGRGAQAQVAATHEKTQDRKIGVNAVSAAANAAANLGHNEKIKHLGALQIEQGNDQRNILIKSAPRAVREELGEKPEALIAAEGRVLRD